MKKIIFRLMTLALVGLFVGCQDDNIISSVVVEGPAPVSSFTYTQEFLVVSFTSTSTNAESYYWDFGDGTTSTEATPVHTYAASGYYDITLKVNSAAGYSSKSETRTVYVAGAAVPYFTFTALSAREFEFDASKSPNLKSAKWDFGDGTPEVEGVTVTHEFADFGTYTVKLIVTGLLDDVVDLELPVIVGEPVVPVYTYSPELGLAVSFDASESENMKSVKWNFGDGSAEVTDAKVIHTFPADGTYHVTLTVTGVLSDVEVIEFDVDVVANYNLLKGSGMEASDGQYWSIYAATSNVVGSWNGTVTFGYTDEKPAAGSGGCVSVYHPTTTSTRVFIWQAANVEAGKKYRFSAQIKLPEGAKGTNYIRFYASAAGLVTSGGYAGYPFSNTSGTFWEVNSENTWPSPTVGYDGDLLAPWVTSGTGRFTGGTAGIFTAGSTGTVYLGFCFYNTGSGGPIRILIDDMKFELIP